MVCCPDAYMMSFEVKLHGGERIDLHDIVDFIRVKRLRRINLPR
jgi:hypothetical protein